MNTEHTNQSSQAAPATLCASCSRANVDCPIYPQQTTSCVEHRDQPQAVAADSRYSPPFGNCKFQLYDLPGQCRSEGKCHHPATAPAVAVPDATYERKRFAKWFCMQDALKEDDASMDGYWAGWLARSEQPPAVAVPELRTVRRAQDGMPSANYAEGYDHGWNDCVYEIRAMLAAAQKDPRQAFAEYHLGKPFTAPGSSAEQKGGAQ